MRARLLLLLFCHVLFVHGDRLFHLGRSKGGNIGAPGDYGGEKLPEAQWFKQKLDHSSPTDLRTWKQRFYVNDQFYDPKEPGPVFLMIGGEGPVDPKWMVKGTWIEYAKKFNALCFNLEHRYYGESHPTPDLNVKNLQFLTSSQALADIANFIKAMNDKYKLASNVNWVTFGGSYPGSLSAWMRLKFPHLVAAAVSSSGPLMAKANFHEYFQVVVNALREKTGGDECVNVIRKAHSEIVEMMINNSNIIETEFNVCKSFSNASENDIKNFYSSIADDFADLVQYNEDNRITNDNRFKNITINNVCNMLTSKGPDAPYKKLARFNKMMLAKSNQTCMDYSYSGMISNLRNFTWGGDEARQWMYQTCTEFGFYQTSSAEVDVFGNQFTLDFFVQQCEDVFGNKYNKDFLSDVINWTNTNYGALDLSVSKVIFVHGSIDPWHALGITKSKDPMKPALYIHGTAHCANMYPSAATDSYELINAREKVEEYLGQWIGLP